MERIFDLRNKIYKLSTNITIKSSSHMIIFLNIPKIRVPKNNNSFIAENLDAIQQYN